MKFQLRIKTLLYNIIDSTKRFPIPLLLSGILFILLIVFNEIDDSLNNTQLDNFIKINMIVGMSILLSLCISLFVENYKSGKKFAIPIFISGGVLVVLYRFFMMKDFSYTSIISYIGCMVFLTLLFSYIAKLNDNNDYEMYVIKTFSGLFITLVYSVILFIGIFAIIFTINTLFELNIDSKFYFYSLLFVIFIFAFALFLSKLPRYKEDSNLTPYSKSLKVLMNYIIIPLISIYTMILYAYFLRIIFTWQWPKGLVSHLVLWYGCIGVVTLFLICPLKQENNISKLFNKIFPKAIIPLLIMMFTSMGQRIQQYGITENRYFVILLGIWIIAIMILYSFKNYFHGIVIPLTLSIVVFISIFGPISAFNVSIMSQNHRLNEILEKNDMLDENNIVENKNVSSEDQIEISNIITYFKNNHELSDIRLLPDNFNTSKMNEIFGFDYIPQYSYSEEEYFNYYFDITRIPVDIKDYDYFISMNNWTDNDINIDGLNVIYDRDTFEITIYEGNNSLFKSSILEYVKQVHEKQKINELDKSTIDSVDKMTFMESTDNLDLKIIFTNLSGNFDNKNNIKLTGGDFYLFINKK